MSFFFGPGGFPGGAGGMPGMGGDSDASDGGEAADNTKYYKMMGLEKNASPTDIKKAYRKLARTLHPDKHPEDPETYDAKFKELQQAYEVLSDPEKKKLYDAYGEAGLSGRGGGSGFGSDIFDMFFNGQGHGHGHGHGHGGGGRGGRQRRKKAPLIREFLDVTLEDLYKGPSKDIEYTKMKVCVDCGGKGGKKVVECSHCNGNGVQVVMKRMGYMTVQTQRECPHCNGEGTSIPDSMKCKKCKGNGFCKINKKMEFHIPRGSKHAEKIVLAGQGHEIPDAANGDLVIVLRCIKHDLFQRIGADLAMTQKISLKEALCGYDILIPHLSGHKLRLKSEKGKQDILQHHQLKAIFSKGMPQKGSANTFGHLYVKVEIVFPDVISDELREQIKKLLPLGDDELDPDVEEEEPEHKQMDEDGDEDELFDEDYEMHEEAETVNGEPKVTPASSRSAYDEDEEDAGVQCKQM